VGGDVEACPQMRRGLSRISESCGREDGKVGGKVGGCRGQRKVV